MGATWLPFSAMADCIAGAACVGVRPVLRLFLIASDIVIVRVCITIDSGG